MARERLAGALLAIAVGQVARAVRTQAGLARSAWTLVRGPADGPRAWDSPPERNADLWRNHLVQVALDWSAGGRDLARALQPTAPDTGPPPAAVVVDGRTVALPTAVRDASQGIGLFAVDPAAARAVLAECGLPFEPVIVGNGAAVLALFVVDYRDGDLGAYFELGAAVIGRPAGDPLAPPGLVVFALPVSGKFTRDCGRQIWGYPKVLAPELAIRREGSWVVCRLAGEDGLRLTFARRGFGASRDVPLVSYTVRDGRPTRTVFRRSGRAERLRAGGRVALALGDGAGGHCPCGLAAAEGSTGCLCARLRALGLPKPPFASGCTETMSGNFGPPEPLPTGAAPPPHSG